MATEAPFHPELERKATWDHDTRNMQIAGSRYFVFRDRCPVWHQETRLVRVDVQLA